MKKINLSRKLLLGGAGAVALVAVTTGGGYALTSGEDDGPIPTADREQAERVALAETGGGTVTDTDLDDDRDEPGRYDVEVTLDDGTEVDVRLDDDFTVVGTETDGPDDRDDTDDNDDDRDDRDDRADDDRDDDRDDD